MSNPTSAAATETTPVHASSGEREEPRPYLHGRAAGDVRLDVVSGEGEQGRAVAYTGSGRLSALKARLTRERCGGDRWARYVARLDDGQAIVLSEHDAEDLLWRQRYPAPAG